MNTETKLTRARVQLLLNHPFYGSLALSLPLKEDNNVNTMATDGKNIYYNKSFADELSEGDAQFIICHEILHCALSHIFRQDGRNKEKWNVAIDFATNAILKKEFDKLPEGALYKTEYELMSAEEIYNKLPQGTEIKKGVVIIDGNKIGRLLDEHKEATGTKEEQEELQQKIKAEVVRAFTNAKLQGNAPSDFDRIIENLVNPKMNWKELLKQFMVSTAKNDYRWYPPNRRFIYKKIYLPSMTSESLGDVVVIIDNSGSIDSETLQTFFTECNALLQTYNMTLHLIICDAEVSSYKTYETGEMISSQNKGGGGTDLKKGFEYITQKGIMPSCIVCLTDGFTDLNFKSQHPTLWVITKEGITLDKIPFGQGVKI